MKVSRPSRLPSTKSPTRTSDEQNQPRQSGIRGQLPSTHVPRGFVCVHDVQQLRTPVLLRLRERSDYSSFASAVENHLPRSRRFISRFHRKLDTTMQVPLLDPERSYQMEPRQKSNGTKGMTRLTYRPWTRRLRPRSVSGSGCAGYCRGHRNS